LVCGYIYANAGEGESTQDLVFGGHNMIAENGTILANSKRFQNGVIYADLDLERIRSERRRMTTFQMTAEMEDYDFVEFEIDEEELDLDRFIDPAPFVPSDAATRDERCEEILTIQAMGLKKRLAHTGCKNAVIGISGGLDSTLALLVMAKAFDMLNIPRENILSVTMPCFGTTDRTYNNACILTHKLGAELKEVVIKEAVNVHFRDLGHDSNVHDVTYENSQARERTQVLMDLANKYNGMVVGTGDMSELALGWATYNGDHMSMYGVNASVPKTLVRHLVRYYADTCGDEELKAVLYDILDTPVSPELLPPTEGEISQKTEDLVGPYELHDFFMYYILRYGYRPSKIFRLAKIAFKGEYSDEIIYKWLNTFYRRFFAQQFKRSCLPDGPKVGSVAVSPRGDLRMPSDAARRIWMDELESIRPEA
ncbi:MAG: NAD(+) synthase, partial [Lachnospiraceae bacterium]|nr:NAD(+) synthase [Lachnospiraceae bacterium]